MQQSYEIGKLYKTINGDETLRGTLHSFTLCFIINGADDVSYTDIMKADELIIKNICLNINGKLIIQNIEAISIGLYLHFKSESNFKESDNFIEYQNLYLDIVKALKANPYSQKKEDILRRLYTLLILRYSLQSYSLADYIHQLSKLDKTEHKNRKRISDFVNAYGTALPELEFKKENLYCEVKSVMALNDSDSNYNYNQHYLIEGLRILPEKDLGVVLDFFETSCNDIDAPIKFIASLSASLYEYLGELFLLSIASPYLGNKKIATEILYGLSIVREVGYNDSLVFIKIYENNNDSGMLIIPLSKMLLSIINSEVTYEGKAYIDGECFKRLEDIIVKYGSSPALQIVDNIAFIKNHENLKTKLLLNLIAQPYFNTKEFLGTIEKVYWYLHSVNSVIQILSAISDKEPFQDLGKNFRNFQENFCKEELDLAIINLIVDNKSSRRYLGNSLFNAYCLQRSFNYNILSLTPLNQYKLWVGLCQNIGEPESYLVSLLSLLDSNSAIVRESFIAKLELLSEDFGRHITEVLEKYSHLYNCPEVLERVKNYIETFYKVNADCKNGIAELNPYNTHYKLIKEFNKLYHRNFSKTIEKGTKENSLLGMMAKTIKLGKGGGWKMPGRENVQKLGHFQSGMVLPRSYFIYPDKYDIMCGIEQKTDRTDAEFEIIIELIANE